MAHDVAPLPAQQAADRPFALLAALDKELWQGAIVCSAGDASLRLAQLPQWQTALQVGHLPDARFDLGDGEAVALLRDVVDELDLCALTEGNAAMAHQLIRVMLWHLDTLIDRPDGSPRAAATRRMADAFRAEWSQQYEDWQEVLALFKTLGDLAHLRWDTLKGHLQGRGWNEAKRIGVLLDTLPELARFIDAVGRLDRRADMPPSVQPQPHAAASSVLAQVTITTHLEDQPSEVRGVKRSGQLARMLASEAVMRGHPLLARVWRARFAERQLLTYEDAAVLTQWQLRPDATHRTRAAAHDVPLGHGPLLVCLDTSGSMRGAPENVAKACVLQALRSAHAHRRACTLLAFGGAGELQEQELALTPQGLEALLALMGQSFDGGTDVQTPLERAVALVQQQRFALADMLIVSDGEFGVTPATLALLRGCKKSLGLRVHHILIGDRETIGVLEVSDQIHWVRDWRRYATHAQDAYSDGFSPVHSRSLTAMYFPNAIRRDPQADDAA